MKAFPPPRQIPVYDPGLRTLHWLMAALIFVALPLGVWGSGCRAEKQRSEILFVHKSIGVTVLWLVVLRIVWRIIVGAPAYVEPLGRLTHAAARAGHLALYALMIAMPVSGYMTSTAGGNASFVVRPVHPSEARGQGQVPRRGGELGAPCLRMGHRIRAGAHLGAVVWHAVIRRDSVLTRMWPRYRPASIGGNS